MSCDVGEAMRMLEIEAAAGLYERCKLALELKRLKTTVLRLVEGTE